MTHRPLTSPYGNILYSVCVTALILWASSARAQVVPPPPPAPATPPATPPAQAPTGGPLAPNYFVIGEEYRVEFSGGAWVTRPSTVLLSDTETISSTTNNTTTTTTLNGTLIDFRSLLGLGNQTFAEGHVTVVLAPRHKLLGDYIPLRYKQTVQSLASDFNFNGQVYKAGQTVESTYRWNEWKAAYEFDALTFDRGFVGGQVAISSMNISAATANATQSGTASVNIFMPGLGAIGRYYLWKKMSVTVDFFGFVLPGNATSTHAHSLEIDGYGTYNLNKHVGVRVGVRAWDASHVWGSPLNTGEVTVVGPYFAGTVRFGS
jgi:hypothetical protein